MIKIYLEQVKQHQTVFYTGKCDPRKLVKMADQTIVTGQIQEAQRPLDKKHLEDISKWVVGMEGLLPSSIMISTKKPDKLNVKQEKVNGETLFYVEFPSTDAEFLEYENTIDVIDGQHRLYAFKDTYRDSGFLDAEAFEMPFSLFELPSLRTRQLLFTITNEKQKAVGRNLLLYLKRQLGMLSKAENTYYPLVELLNNECKSPLKGRIIMNAEKIKKGYKSTEIIKICDRAKLVNFFDCDENVKNQKLLDVITTYLKGWESFYSFSFQNPQKDTITKISGLRYIMLMLQTFWDHSVNSKVKWTIEFVKNTIQDFEDCKELEDDQTLFDDSTMFRGEGATVSVAAEDSTKLKAYLSSKSTAGFDPLA